MSDSLRYALAVLSMAIAASAAANDFAITPNAPCCDTANYRWSISIDSGAAQDNPTLTVLTGQTYTFSVNTSFIHPFWIDRAPGIGGQATSDPYPFPGDISDNGVTSQTTITFNVPVDAPDTLYYACGNHSAMNGTITVVHDLVYRDNFESP